MNFRTEITEKQRKGNNDYCNVVILRVLCVSFVNFVILIMPMHLEARM